MALCLFLLPRKKGSKIPPLPLNLCSGQVWTPKWTRCMNPTLPHLPRKAFFFFFFFFFYRERIRNASKMCASCFALSLMKWNDSCAHLKTHCCISRFSTLIESGGSIYLHEWKRKLPHSPLFVIMHVLKSLEHKPTLLSLSPERRRPVYVGPHPQSVAFLFISVNPGPPADPF